MNKKIKSVMLMTSIVGLSLVGGFSGKYLYNTYFRTTPHSVATNPQAVNTNQGVSFQQPDANGNILYSSSDNSINPEETQQDSKGEYIKVERAYLEDKEQITSLAKTFLVASFETDWDVVKAISTGDYKKNIEDNIKPTMSKYLDSKQASYEFNPRSFSVNFKSINNYEAVAIVDFIVSKGTDGELLPFQEQVTLYLSKENETWKIVSAK